jgi:hypothetical protein
MAAVIGIVEVGFNLLARKPSLYSPLYSLVLNVINQTVGTPRVEASLISPPSETINQLLQLCRSKSLWARLSREGRHSHPLLCWYGADNFG